MNTLQLIIIFQDNHSQSHQQLHEPWCATNQTPYFWKMVNSGFSSKKICPRRKSLRCKNFSISRPKKKSFRWRFFSLGCKTFVYFIIDFHWISSGGFRARHHPGWAKKAIEPNVSIELAKWVLQPCLQSSARRVQMLHQLWYHKSWKPQTFRKIRHFAKVDNWW